MSHIYRERALETYYAHPSICLNCNLVIPVRSDEKPTVTRRKKFCDTKCAGIYNNGLRKKPWLCKDCGLVKDRPTPRSKYCKDCKSRKHVHDSITVEQLIERYNGNTLKAFGIIRSRARESLVRLGRIKCSVCHYWKHFEAAHVKGISEWSTDSTLAQINDLSNLASLCPTHHWELDYDTSRDWKL